MLTFFKIILKLCGYFVQAIWLVIKIVYRILKAFKVRVLVLYLLVCGILQLALHTFDGEKILYFWIGLGVCVAISVVAWLAVYYKQEKKRMKREKEREQEREEKLEKKQKRKQATQEDEEEIEIPKKATKKKTEEGTFYEVEGKPDYMFAEYSDRYELYRKEHGKLVLVRIDKKEGEKK